jgi:flagellar biosynthesis protein FliR
MIARSAPTLNLFSVGLPATLIAGVILLAIATPVMADTLLRAISDALDQARLLGHG